MIKQEYIDHADQNFSLFHRHGSTGRDRARDLIEELSQLKTRDQVLARIDDEINNGKGNLHDHSLRTILSNLLSEQDDEDERKVDERKLSR